MKDHFREELKKYIAYNLSCSRNYCTTYKEVLEYQAISYGAVQFFINACPNEYEDISSWWDEQKIEFQRIANKK